MIAFLGSETKWNPDGNSGITRPSFNSEGCGCCSHEYYLDKDRKTIQKELWSGLKLQIKFLYIFYKQLVFPKWKSFDNN